jgi:hypothetical protein
MSCLHGNKERSFIRQNTDGTWACRECGKNYVNMTEALSAGMGVDLTPEPEKSPMEYLIESWEFSAQSCRKGSIGPYYGDAEYAQDVAKAEVYESCAKELRDLLSKKDESDEQV